MAGRGGSKGDANYTDRPYDEAIPIETDDEDVSTPASSERGSDDEGSPTNNQLSPQRGGPGAHKASPGGAPASGGGDRGNDDDSESESSSSSSTESHSSDNEDEDGDKKSKASMPSGAYNPDDYNNMKVSSDIQELFEYITRYKPHTIDLDTSLKPFIPELIPSIGEVDAFLKMPRPDEKASGLGCVMLDEPTLNPSDPSILDLQLRSLSKHQDLTPMEVRSIENAEKNPKEIENWVKRIEDLNRAKPAPTVQYSRRMPDIEQLMQVWASEFEEFLQGNALPELSDLDLDLPSYIKIIASLLDVPVGPQMTETLHVIFTLYSEFKTNQHFSKTDTMAMNQDQYNFGPAPNFGASGTMGMHAPGATGPVFGGPPTESVAPSRAPSPVQNRGGGGGGEGPIHG